jgi:chorismate mutase
VPTSVAPESIGVPVDPTGGLPAPAGGTVVRAVRGAVQIDRDSPALLAEGTRELLVEVMTRNGLTGEELISVFFTVTPDLTSGFPAAAARGLGLIDVPLMCATEIEVPGALPRVVRLMAHVHTDRPRSRIEHVYLRGAARLRPDLVNEERKPRTW